MFLHNMSQLKQRLTISFFSIAILLFSITFSHNPLFKPIFVLLTAAVIAFAQWEYYHIAQRKGLTPLITLGVLASLLYLFSNFLVIENANLEPLPFMVLWLTLIATFLYYFSKGANPYSNIATTLFGIVYLTIPLSLLLNITYFFPEGATQDGRLWLFYLLLTTKMTDTGAFFIGRKFGNHKMAPYISPNKSWEGSVAGLCTTVLSSLFFLFMIRSLYDTPPFSLTYFQSIWVAAIISLLAQIGDLSESLLKRDGGVKDSSHIPGLGGMLDMVDSVIFTCPFIYFFLKISY